MAEVQIETSQNVRIAYELAGLGDRMLAGLLDLVFRVAYVVIFALLVFTGGIFDIFDNLDFANLGVWVAFLLIFLPFTFYHLLFELFMDGQSPGKRIMKIKVIKIEGIPISIGDYVMRWMFRMLDGMLYVPLCMFIPIPLSIVGMVTIAATKHSQRIGDLAAGTTVVRIKRSTRLSDTIIRAVEPSYQVVYPQIYRLSDADMNTIRAALEISEKSNNLKTMVTIATKAAEILEIDPESIPQAKPFLQTLLLDYNAHFRKDLAQKRQTQKGPTV